MEKCFLFHPYYMTMQNEMGVFNLKSASDYVLMEALSNI